MRPSSVLGGLLIAASLGAPFARAQERVVARDVPVARIPDRDARGVQRALVATQVGQVRRLAVGIYALHARRGDLEVTLVSPRGTRVLLHRPSLRDLRRDLGGVFGLNLTPAEPLERLAGEAFAGSWTLEVRDLRGGATGRLVAWSLQAELEGPAPVAQRFEVILENVSGASALPTPLAPGAWALHRAGSPLFTPGRPASPGLEALAEDGGAPRLDAELALDPAVLAHGVFDTPVAGQGPGPAMPGGAYRFEVLAAPGDRLSFATMVGQSNDLFLAPDGAGVALFDDAGRPLPERSLEAVRVWDAGSEANQAPGIGPDQAPRQAAAGAGRAEGALGLFSDATRAIPAPRALVEVRVARTGDRYDVTWRNVSDRGGAMRTPVTPVLHVLHAAGYELFRAGEPAPVGLEPLAEDGDASVWAARLRGAPGVGAAGVAGAGPILPGEEVSFSLIPSAAFPAFDLASMVGHSNDAFLSVGGGIALLDARGGLRPAADVEADLRRRLQVWDAGTEQNQVPGVGPDTAPLQAGPGAGAPDPDGLVRRYVDPTNDLAGPGAGGFARVSVRAVDQAGTFEVTLRNTSGGALPGRLSPVVSVLHAGGPLFRVGAPASSGIADMAEDGETAGLAAELRAGGGEVMVGPSGVRGGMEYRFTVRASAARRFLNLFTMVVPSNDAWLAFDPQGLELVDAQGRPRSAAQLEAEANQRLVAWDAGSEANQAGGVGPDQPPPVHGQGADEGAGRVRLLDDPVWPVPAAAELVRVRIRPLR